MLTKTVKYEDFNGVQKERNLNFNLTKAELAEMELSTAGGLQSMLERIIKENDQTKLVELFKQILVKSYGIKSDDGERFNKSKEITDDFVNSAAYAELYIELASDDKAASDFILGILPSDLRAAVIEEQSKQKNAIPPVASTTVADSNA